MYGIIYFVGTLLEFITVVAERFAQSVGENDRPRRVISTKARKLWENGRSNLLHTARSDNSLRRMYVPYISGRPVRIASRPGRERGRLGIYVSTCQRGGGTIRSATSQTTPPRIRVPSIPRYVRLTRFVKVINNLSNF